jgi:cyanophycin synthetase
VIGLDVAGIDLIAPDISESVLETGGAICEVNGGPGLFVVHTQPDEGKPRNVTGPVIDLLFPPGNPSRVPIIAVTGANGATATSRIIAKILTVAGHSVGVASTEGIDIGGTRIVRGNMTGSDSPRIVLRNPSIDAAVLETSYKGILCSGLGYDRAEVAVITSVSGQHKGVTGTYALGARLSAVVANSTSEGGVTVLNADDPWCVRIGRDTNGEVIYFSLRSDSEVVRQHLQAGGRALTASPTSDCEIFSRVNGAKTTIALPQETAVAGQERTVHNIVHALAATAACVALGINHEYICQGLRSFVEG